MEENKTKQQLLGAWHCILNSYGQIFFSKNPVFAVILLLVTFFDFYAGLAGLLAVVISNSVASLLGLSKIDHFVGLFHAFCLTLQPSFGYNLIEQRYLHLYLQIKNTMKL